MNLSVYDKDLHRIFIIGTAFKSCLWSEGYNTCQPFTLELDATPEYKEKIKPDCYVGRSDRPTLMVIKSVHASDNKIIATGKQATRILSDVNFIGTISSGSCIDNAISNAYNGSNRYRALSIDISNPISAKYNHQVSNKSFLDLCNIMCQDADVGYKIVKSGSGMVLKFYQPEENPNLIFSEAFGNLSAESVTDSTEPLKNYAVILGQGEGNSREKVIVDLSGGADRRELIVDAKDLRQEQSESLTAYRSRLTARGIEKLLDRKETKNIVFSPIASDFGTRFDLGDILKVNMPDYGLKLKARVSKFTQKEQGNSTETTVSVGEITILR